MPADQLNALAEVERASGATHQPTLGVIGTLRWTWRRLTSMRTALILLFLMALGSVPGSVFPQRGASPLRVGQYLGDVPVQLLRCQHLFRRPALLWRSVNLSWQQSARSTGRRQSFQHEGVDGHQQ